MSTRDGCARCLLTCFSVVAVCPARVGAQPCFQWNDVTPANAPGAALEVAMTYDGGAQHPAARASRILALLRRPRAWLFGRGLAAAGRGSGRVGSVGWRGGPAYAVDEHQHRLPAAVLGAH
jgi:hypothetical protein